MLAKRRLPEGVAGMARLHELVGQHLGEDADDAEVVVGIETDRGPWVAALVAAGYTVFAVNPLQASRYRERHGVSGAKSDGGDAHMLADMVRTDSHQLRAVAGRQRGGGGHQGAGPHAQDADLGADPAGAAAAAPAAGVLPRRAGGLRGPGRPRHPGAAGQGPGPGPGREADPRAGQRRAQARPPPRTSRTRPPRSWPRCAASSWASRAAVTAAYAATVRSLIAVITALNEQVKTLQGQVEEDFGRHPDAEIYRSQPGMGAILGARVLGEFGDDPHRYADGKARRNYAATSPITRASGKKKVVAARFIHNDRLVDALNAQAFASLNASPGARALYDELRARGIEHNDALRRLANRLVGILHGCLKTRTLYDEATAWGHRQNLPQSSVAA